MTRLDITVCIPTIPSRADRLARALESVYAQTQPAAVSVFHDLDGMGAAAARNAAVSQADTEWVAFLDDDDWLYPQHLDHLLVCAERTGADLVYPWFEAVGGTDPLFIDGQRAAMRPFDDKAREWLINSGNFIPITCLVRREVLLDAGGFAPPPFASPHNPCEDWGAWRAIALAGGKFFHLPERTWRWEHWHGHTSGRPWK